MRAMALPSSDLNRSAARPKSPVSPMIASTMQRIGTSRSTIVAVLRPNGRPEISRLAKPASPTAPGDQHREDQGDAAAEGEHGKQRENPEAEAQAAAEPCRPA